MSIVTIDPTDRAVAVRIVEIQRAAYAVEASLMEFDGIPQLTETADQVRTRTELTWHGLFEADRLVAVIAWQVEDGLTDIDRLAVDPDHARRGYGRRLVRSVPTDRTTIVSTGTRNDPATRLYLGEGFVPVDQIEVAPEVFMTRFRRTPEPERPEPE